MMRMFAKHGIDIRKEPILVYPTLHYQNGGLHITADGQTDVENLFAAGEVVGGIHGRNRLMGNSLLDVIVFGRNAGQHAAEKAKSVSVGTLTLDHVAAFEAESSRPVWRITAFPRNCCRTTPEKSIPQKNKEK